MNKSNVCVSGDSLLLTLDGYQSIQDLVTKKVTIWNGSEFTDAVIKKAEGLHMLYLLTTNDGCELKCTLGHSFFTINEKNRNFPMKKKLSELNVGDEIIKCDFPIIAGNPNKDMIDPYTIGLLVIDGDTYDIPINSSLNNKLFWLAGFIDGNGELVFKDGQYEIKISYMYKDFLYNVKLMCNTIQLNPRMHVVSPSIIQLVEHLNGKITYNLYFNAQETYMMLRSPSFPIQKILLPASYYPDKVIPPIKVQSINKLNEYTNVYYFEEPKKGTGIINGLINGK